MDTGSDGPQSPGVILLRVAVAGVVLLAVGDRYDTPIASADPR